MVGTVQATFIAGAVIFGVGALITAAIFIYFLWKGYSSSALSKSADNVRSVHWLNSIWVYPCLCTSMLLLTLLYATSATGYGLLVKPNLTIVHWLRWLILAMLGFVFYGCLALILTEEDVSYNKEKRPFLRMQSFFGIFYYIAAYLCIEFASISPTVPSHITWMVCSIIAFIISILLFFFPYNKISVIVPEHPHDYALFTGNDHGNGNGRSSPNDQSGVDGVKYSHYSAKLRENIIYTYRGIFLAMIIISYVYYVIIWFLSNSNDIATAINFRVEMASYLVGDILYIGVFTVVFIVLTFYYRMKIIAIRDTVSGVTSFQQQQSTYNNVHFSRKQAASPIIHGF